MDGEGRLQYNARLHRHIGHIEVNSIADRFGKKIKLQILPAPQQSLLHVVARDLFLVHEEVDLAMKKGR